MKNLRISRKLFLAFGVLSAALIIMMVLSIISQSRLNATAETLGRSRREKIVAIANINTASAHYRASEVMAILAEDSDQRLAAYQDVQARAAVIAKNTDYLDRNLTSPTAIEQFRTFKAYWSPFATASRQTLELAGQGLTRDA